MKWLTAGMRQEFVASFVQWMKEHYIETAEPFELDGIWYVMYQPIGKVQAECCERYIEYSCYNDLM